MAIALAGCGRVDFEPAADAVVGDAPVPAMVRYPMDDDPSTGVVIATDPRFDGTCTSCPTASAGHLAGGYAFASAQDIQLPAISAVLAGAAPYTCTVWSMLTTPSAESLVAKPYSQTDVTDVFAIQILPIGDPYFETVTPTDAVDYLTANTSAPLGEWHQYAVTWDGSTKRIYLDGAPQGTEPASTLDSNQPIVIGADQDNGAPIGWFAGSLDELTFYDHALSDSEIAVAAAP